MGTYLTSLAKRYARHIVRRSSRKQDWMIWILLFPILVYAVTFCLSPTLYRLIMVGFLFLTGVLWFERIGFREIMKDQADAAKDTDKEV